MPSFMQVVMSHIHITTRPNKVTWFNALVVTNGRKRNLRQILSQKEKAPRKNLSAKLTFTSAILKFINQPIHICNPLKTLMCRITVRKIKHVRLL